MFVPWLVLMALPLQATWTVDDNGPADFVRIDAAIAAAADGDLILIQPGTYQPFVLDKDLRLVGRTTHGSVNVSGVSVVTGVGRFALTGLELSRLRVTEVSEDGLIDSCKIGPFSSSVSVPAALEIADAAQVLVQRSTCLGGSVVTGFSDWAGDGALVDTSNVVFVGCTFQGDDGNCLDGTSDGGDGLVIKAASNVVLAGCTASGGLSMEPGLITCSGAPGYGISVSSSVLIVRGAANDQLKGGYDIDHPASVNDAIHSAGSTVLWSGVTLAVGGIGATNSLVLHPAEPEPFTRVTGGTAPGQTVELSVTGPSGAPGLLLMATSAGHADLAKWDADLWLDSSQLVVLQTIVTAGPASPVVFGGTLPPDPLLAGLELRGQIAFAGLPSGLGSHLQLLANPFAVPFSF